MERLRGGSAKHGTVFKLNKEEVIIVSCTTST
jgi:hypothetical protein